MDLTNMTLVSLAAIGTVNVIGFFKPKMDSKLKWTLSFLAALAISFIPADLGSIILTHIKDAIYAATVGSGIYKVATKIGENNLVEPKL